MADKLTKLTEEQIASIASFAVEGSIDFIERDIQKTRTVCQKYYNGETDIGEEENRSKVVATKVRDTIRAAVPSMMRVFLSSDRPVEYVPCSPDKAQEAETATKYASKQFDRAGGYRVLREVLLDSLVKKVGIAKAYWDTTDHQEFIEYSNLSQEEMAFILGQENTQVIDIEDDDDTGLITKIKVVVTTSTGKLVIESVPPEDFFIDESATSLKDFYCCGQRSDMRVSDLVEMGFDYDEVADLGSMTSDDEDDEERIERTGTDETDIATEDPSMKWVTVTEAYMKMDIEGTGIAQLHKILLGGRRMKLLDYSPVDCVPYAAFEIDPEPHTFFGRSMAESLLNEQDVATVMMRSIVDNVAMTNSPQIEVDDSIVNISDLMNKEIGAIIRSSQVGQGINPITVPFVAGQTLTAVQYFDMQCESKTGVYAASNGLHPDALQNSTAAAVHATTQASAGQLEIYARNIAEGGLTELFTLILKLIIENSPEGEMMEMGGQYVPLSPKTWDVNMRMSVNVGLGTGKEEQKLAALMKSLEIQQGIIAQYGPENGVVSLENVRNTIADMLAINGIRNIDRYFPPIQPQPPQPEQPQEDPNAAFIAIEREKAQIRAQADIQKATITEQGKDKDRQLKAMELAKKDDLDRDQMDQELLINAAEIIGKYGTSVDVERIKAMQAAPRQ